MPKLYQNAHQVDVLEAMIETIKSASCKESTGFVFCSTGTKETLRHNMSTVVKIINEGKTMNVSFKNRALSMNYPHYDFDRNPISAESFSKALNTLGLTELSEKFSVAKVKAIEAETAWKQACAQLNSLAIKERS